MQVTHINENSVVDLHFQECLEQLKWGPQVTVANGCQRLSTVTVIVHT
jgi:hypothetical protein